MAVVGFTAYNRIRDAALEGFARNGVAATSIRDVARAAGVTAGTVQHHFPSKQALCTAVDEHVIAIARSAFAEFPEYTEPTEIQRELGDRLTSVIREHPIAMRYVARGVTDGDQQALRIFAEFVAIARGQWDRVAAVGLLRPDLDRDWAVLHPIVLALGGLLLQAGLDRQLEGPFLSDIELDRWNAATNALFRSGVYVERGHP